MAQKTQLQGLGTPGQVRTFNAKDAAAVITTQQGHILGYDVSIHHIQAYEHVIHTIMPADTSVHTITVGDSV